MGEQRMEESIAGYSPDEWEKIKTEFERDYANSIKYNKSFSELIGEILEGESERSFADKTGLSENMLYRLREQVDEKDPPQRSTLISVCIGYKIGLMTTLALLHSLGLDFTCHNKRDCAYIYLLTRCSGKSVDECNKILQGFGIEEKYWLGSYAKKQYK